MKRFLAVAVLLLCSGISKASIFDKQTDAVAVNYKTATITNSTATIVIDLSDTTNYPHKESRSISIIGMDVEIDKVAAGTSTVRVGVVTSVNIASGTVSWFHGVNNANNVSNTNMYQVPYYVPAEINTFVNSSGATPYFITTEKTATNSADTQLFQTDVPILTAVGTAAAPAVGDIVAEINAGASNGTSARIAIRYLALP